MEPDKLITNSYSKLTINTFHFSWGLNITQEAFEPSTRFTWYSRSWKGSVLVQMSIDFNPLGIFHLCKGWLCIFSFFPRPAAQIWMRIFGVRWVHTSSTSPRQRSYVARHCAVLTAAVCGKTQTVMFTCIWTRSATVWSAKMASWQSLVSLAKQRRWVFVQSFSASVTVAMRERAAII